MMCENYFRPFYKNVGESEYINPYETFKIYTNIRYRYLFHRKNIACIHLFLLIIAEFLIFLSHLCHRSLQTELDQALHGSIGEEGNM